MPVSGTLKGMEVHFTTEQETRLAQLAVKAGTDAEPVWDLGAIGSLHRRDLYDDVR
jgi:hypothetical protein